jgi:uncharacterized membrane protein YeiB
MTCSSPVLHAMLRPAMWAAAMAVGAWSVGRLWCEGLRSTSVEALDIVWSRFGLIAAMAGGLGLVALLVMLVVWLVAGRWCSDRDGSRGLQGSSPRQPGREAE